MSRNEPLKEFEILRYLNSESLRSSSGNRTIPLLAEFLSEDDAWVFFVMPAWRMAWDKEILGFQIDDYFNLVIQSLEVGF